MKTKIWWTWTIYIYGTYVIHDKHQSKQMLYKSLLRLQSVRLRWLFAVSWLCWLVTVLWLLNVSIKRGAVRAVRWPTTCCCASGWEGRRGVIEGELHPLTWKSPLAIIGIIIISIISNSLSIWGTTHQESQLLTRLILNHEYDKKAAFGWGI